MTNLCDVEDKLSEKSHWGPIYWRFLHTISVFYDDTQKEYYTYFFNNVLPSIIPCDECQEHYKTYIKINPPDFSDRLSLMTWLLDFHNMGNGFHGKKIYSFDDMLEDMYNNY